MEVYFSSQSWESTPKRREKQPTCPSLGPRPGGTPVRRPRARASAASGNPACRKYRGRTGLKRPGGGARIGVKRRLPGLLEPATKSHRWMMPAGRGSLVVSPQPRNAALPAHLAAMPVSRTMFEYMRATGLLTPTRLSRIPVLGTPQRVNPPPAPSVVPPDAHRAIPPGIERMLRQIRAPQRAMVRTTPPQVTSAAAIAAPLHHRRVWERSKQSARWASMESLPPPSPPPPPLNGVSGMGGVAMGALSHTPSLRRR